jgi:hypothetical protein
MVYYCKDVPPFTPPLRNLFVLGILGVILVASAPVWLFFLWGLTNLTLIASIIWLITLIAILDFIVQPVRNFKRTRARVLNLPKKD